MSIFDTINRNISKFTSRVSGGTSAALSTPIITPEERKLPFENFISRINNNVSKLTEKFGQVRQTPLTMERDEVSQRIKSGIDKLSQRKNIFQTAGEIGQSIARSFASIGAAKDALIQGKDPFSITVIPETKFQKKIFGTEEAFSFESIGREMADIAGEGVGVELSSREAMLIGLVVGGLDAIPITSGKSKVAYQAIAKTNVVDDIFKLVKPLFKGSDEDIKALSIGLKDVSDPKVVEDIITKVKNTPVVKGVDTLSTKARKAIAEGKTADEFVKANNTNPTILFRGIKRGYSTEGRMGETWVTSDFDIAQRYAGKDGRVVSFPMSDNIKGSWVIESETGTRNFQGKIKLTDKGTEITKSQLTDFYTQAVKGVSPELKVAKPKISETSKPVVEPRISKDIKKPTISSQAQKKLIQEESRLGDQVIKGQSPIQNKSLGKSYQIFGNDSSIIKESEKSLSPITAGGKTNKIGLGKRFSNAMSNYWTKANEVIQDDWYRVRQLVNKKGIKVSDASDPYLKRELYFGRVGTKIEDVKDIVKAIDKDVLKTSKKIGIPDKQLADEVNDYLYFRHAPERNLALGDGAAGITTKEAQAGLKALESSTHATEIKRIANELQNLNNETLDVLLDGQVISQDLYNTLRNKYKNHIPLQRIFADSENVSDILSSAGLDVRGTGIIRAKGSQREVADIFANITSNYEQALIKSEKNRVDLATLKFARENKYFDGLFEEVKPKAIGKTFDGKIIKQEIKDPQILALRENGKPVYLKINDPQLAVALKGVNRQKLDAFTRIIGSFTRLYSGLMTRFNPEFAIPNKIRDLQEMAVYMASKKEVGFKGAAKTVVRDPKSSLDILDWMRGKNTKGAKLYQEMKDLGGTTGGLGLSTRKQIELDIESIRKLNRKSPRKAAEKVIGYVDSWNTLFEDSTRLSVYKQGIKNGLSKERAAFLAKESTINFNRMGTAGPIVNALWMFSNASIQGSVKMLRAMKNPKVAAIVISSVSGAVLASQEWNDSIDLEWRDKVSEWDRMNGISIVLPGDDKFNYITIPVSWGLKPINVMANYAIDAMNDKGTDLEDAMSGIFASVIDAYNPVGGTDFTSAITPTIIDLPLDIKSNQKWSGNTIRPDWDKYAPMSERYFDSLGDTELGKFMINTTQKISEKSGGRIEISPADASYATQQLIGGAGRFITKGVNTITDIFKGEPQVREIPFVSRFLRSRDAEEAGYKTGVSKEIKDILTEQSRERIVENREAESIYEEMKKLPKEQAKEVFNELLKKDKAMAKKISDIGKEEKLGLTYTDRLIKQLGVENGERAKYIYSQLMKLEDKESKSVFWKELVDKKLISDKVNEQIMWLISGNKP